MTDAELEAAILQIGLMSVSGPDNKMQELMYELFKRWRELRRDFDALDRRVYGYCRRGPYDAGGPR